jgi:hypothetical protein
MRVYIREEDLKENRYCDNGECPLARSVTRKLKIKEPFRVTVGPGRVRIWKGKRLNPVRQFEYEDGHIGHLSPVEKQLMGDGKGFHMHIREVAVKKIVPNKS